MSRWALTALAALLIGCAAPGDRGAAALLTSADPATSLIAGASLTMTERTEAAQPGQDPLVLMTLTHADGRVMAFEQANHAPDHVRAQAAGGALAQIMGLFGDEAPVLYAARTAGNRGAPFICAPQGPVALGFYRAPDGAVRIIGLKQEIQFETRPDGQVEALPYSPDMVCARMAFRR